MRRLFLTSCALAAFAAGLARGQDLVQEFSGSGGTTTAMFTVGDRWEVRWNARQAISVAAMSSNGTLIAGASGVLRGSLFVPAGGQYYLKITDGTVAPPSPSPPPIPNIPPAANTNAPPTTNAPASASTNAAPATNTDTVPEPVSVVSVIDTTPAPVASWHVQVVQLAQTVASTDSLTVYTPYFTVPDSAITAPGAPPPPPPPVLTPDQVNSLVTIKGDSVQGSGFLLRATDGVYVVAHLRLLANNPNLQITTISGAPVKILSMKAASDRNLVLIAVQDDHFKCLGTLTDKDTPAALGDYVIIPTLGQTDQTAAKVGKIINMGPERFDCDASIDLANNSAPVIAVATGKVLGIVTAEKGIDLTETTAKAWAENPVPGLANIVPYFALSVDNVPGWEPLDLTSFNQEGQVLKDFHNTTRCLDSYLNGTRRPRDAPAAAPNSPPDSRTYKSNPQIVSASDNFRKQANPTEPGEAPDGQTADAARELLDDLQTIAKTNVDQLQSMTPRYAINLRRLHEELAYRAAIQAELSTFGDNIARLSYIAQNR